MIQFMSANHAITNVLSPYSLTPAMNQPKSTGTCALEDSPVNQQ